jgi:hypothetical protein
MAVHPEHTKDLEAELLIAHHAAVVLQAEINQSTVSRLFDDQVKLVQQGKDLWDKYQALVEKLHPRKRH